MKTARLEKQLVPLLSRIRVRDAIVFQSPSVIAMALRIPALQLAYLVPGLLVSLGSFLIMAHIFAFNDWADMALDYQNQHKRGRSLVERGIPSREILYLASGLAALGILAVGLVSLELVPIAASMILLGIVYSFPVGGLKAKGIPVVSSALHLAGTVLTYLLGSATFAPIDPSAVLLGCYFGILITAGHLVQETQDYTEDRLAGVRTNAVQFGQAPVFVVSFGLFGFSFLFLAWLAWRGMVPAVAGFCTTLLPLYAIWAIRVYRRGLDSSDVRQLRKRYRMLFSLVALVLVAGALIEKSR